MYSQCYLQLEYYIEILNTRYVRDNTDFKKSMGFLLLGKLNFLTDIISFDPIKKKLMRFLRLAKSEA